MKQSVRLALDFTSLIIHVFRPKKSKAIFR